MPICEKKLYAQLVAQLILIDGSVTDAERSFLTALMTRIGLTEAEQQNVILQVNVDDDVETRVRQLSREARVSLLMELEEAAKIDDVVLASERDLIARVRNSMDL
ncbi:MAG: hypothetical protein ACPG4T_21375 [Nannocystaceae bacterium]